MIISCRLFSTFPTQRMSVCLISCWVDIEWVPSTRKDSECQFIMGRCRCSISACFWSHVQGRNKQHYTVWLRPEPKVIIGGLILHESAPAPVNCFENRSQLAAITPHTFRTRAEGCSRSSSQQKTYRGDWRVVTLYLCPPPCFHLPQG